MLYPQVFGEFRVESKYEHFSLLRGDDVLIERR